MRASRRARNRSRPPSSKSDELETVQTSIISQEQYWQGPLPPPQTLEQFRQIVPDAPERIIRQWEEESEHRRAFEAKSLDATIKKDRRGQFSAISFALGALLLAGFSLWLGQPWVAGVIGGGTIASVVGAFLYQRKK